jgi:membrane protein DedA with SNARE-associated domain
LIAGTSGFGIRRFFVYDVIGETVWIFGYGGLGYLFGTQWESVSNVLSNISGLSLGLVLLAIGVWLGIRRLRTIEANKAKVPEV